MKIYKKSMSNLNRKIKTKIIYEYHEVTKHGFGKFSRSKSMDWNCQPNVFRTFVKIYF